MYTSYFMGVYFTFANLLHFKPYSHIDPRKGRACIQHTEVFLVLFLTFPDDVSFGKILILFMSQFSPL